MEVAFLANHYRWDDKNDIYLYADNTEMEIKVIICFLYCSWIDSSGFAGTKNKSSLHMAVVKGGFFFSKIGQKGSLSPLLT